LKAYDEMLVKDPFTPLSRASLVALTTSITMPALLGESCTEQFEVNDDRHVPELPALDIYVAYFVIVKDGEILVWTGPRLDVIG